MMEVDLHGMELSDAMAEIFYALKECKATDDGIIRFIHGYHSGTVLRNYIRSKKFRELARRDGYHLTPVKGKKEGASIFRITFL